MVEKEDRVIVEKLETGNNGDKPKDELPKGTILVKSLFPDMIPEHLVNTTPKPPPVRPANPQEKADQIAEYLQKVLITEKPFIKHDSDINNKEIDGFVRNIGMTHYLRNAHNHLIFLMTEKYNENEAADIIRIATSDTGKYYNNFFLVFYKDGETYHRTAFDKKSGIPQLKGIDYRWTEPYVTAGKIEDLEKAIKLSKAEQQVLKIKGNIVYYQPADPENGLVEMLEGLEFEFIKYDYSKLSISEKEKLGSKIDIKESTARAIPRNRRVYDGLVLLSNNRLMTPAEYKIVNG